MLLSSKDDDGNKIKPTGARRIVLTSRVMISTAANLLLNPSPIHLVIINFKFCLSGSVQHGDGEHGLGVQRPWV